MWCCELIVVIFDHFIYLVLNLVHFIKFLVVDMITSLLEQADEGAIVTTKSQISHLNLR